MLLIRGRSVYAQFRANRLLSDLQAAVPNITKFSAEYVYFVESGHKLREDQYQRLFDLLDAKEEAAFSEQEQLILVMPRPGTISPWSSRATDIAIASGLDNVGRIERGIIFQVQLSYAQALTDSELEQVYHLLHDPMTETVGSCLEDANILFMETPPGELRYVDVVGEGRPALARVNEVMGLALNDAELDYLTESFLAMQRNPSDAELMMYAQANSEHCRHKIFNANWTIDGDEQEESLFQMIRYTKQQSPNGVLSAYSDNGAVLEGHVAERVWVDAKTKQYQLENEATDIVIKVETHNHPTAVCPYPGAATGAGGEIRDEGATGRGAKPKAGLVGFSVSNLHIPDFAQPWEDKPHKPMHIASSLDIMLDAPIGSARYNNEFGRPNLCGYFRTLEQRVDQKDPTKIRGYHKPIMIAGGLGNIRRQHVAKQKLGLHTQIILLGGPAMQIGLGGGAASSADSSEGREEIDFASVQRGNPEMERRAQEVINSCCALGDDNPILSIHDVGAGGVANAIPEILHDSDVGGRFELRVFPNDDVSMSPMAIWCNEAQERYVLAIEEKNLELFHEIAARERCIYAVVGEVTENEDLLVGDGYFDNIPVEIPMALLFEGSPKLERKINRQQQKLSEFNYADINLSEALQRVLRLPAVADKSFLITIGDRSVGGLTVRDQMVGPWQIPVADCAVTATDFTSHAGEAMAMGERTPVAATDAASSARMAVAEAVMNILAGPIAQLSDIKLSANWMAAANEPGDDVVLFDAVKAVGKELCPALGIAIPVGKDSLSMSTKWRQGDNRYQVTAPLSLIISAFAPVSDIRQSLTPQLQQQASQLLFIDLANGKQRLGCTALAQCYQQWGSRTADVESPELLKSFATAIIELRQQGLLLAYHDRSDGGLIVTLLEMAFAGHCGLDINIDELGTDAITSLFNEELGAVIQVADKDIDQVRAIFAKHGFADHLYSVANINQRDAISIKVKGAELLQQSRIELQQAWSETSFKMQSLRDNPICAEQAFTAISEEDPGLTPKLSFDLTEDVAAPYIKRNVKPKVAILREQGVNGQVEMAAAFMQAGFDCVDVHMTDIISERIKLDQFKGLAACGGFSYGDVLGAGVGWAKTIVLNPTALAQFQQFFERNDTFGLGVCNGCQMLSHLKNYIPGAASWPNFISNQSEQFEARLAMVQVADTPSVLLQGMAGSQLPVVVSHGEGCAQFAEPKAVDIVREKQLIGLQYVDNHGHITQCYPANPNGSPRGITALCNEDGRFTIMMPHPERVFRASQFSWAPAKWGKLSPWARMFANARVFVD